MNRFLAVVLVWSATVGILSASKAHASTSDYLEQRVAALEEGQKALIERVGAIEPKLAALTTQVKEQLGRLAGWDCSAICQVHLGSGAVRETMPFTAHGLNAAEALQSVINQCAELKGKVEYAKEYRLLTSSGEYATVGNSCQHSQEK